MQISLGILNTKGLLYTMQSSENLHRLLTQQIHIITDCIAVLTEVKRAAVKLKMNDDEVLDAEMRINKRLTQVLRAEITQNYLDAYALRFYHPVSKVKKDVPSPARKLPFNKLEELFANYHALHSHTEPALTMVVSKVVLGYDDAPGMLEWQWHLDFIIYFIELFMQKHTEIDYTQSANRLNCIAELLNNERTRRVTAITEGNPRLDEIVVEAEQEPESEYILFEYISQKLTKN